MKRAVLALVVLIAALVALGVLCDGPRHAHAQDFGARFSSCSAGYTGRIPIQRNGHTYTPTGLPGASMVCVGLDFIPYVQTAKDGDPAALTWLSLAWMPVEY